MFYEVNLSDCDGSNATIHILDNGKVIRQDNSSLTKVKRLASLCRPSETDDDMPEWAISVMRKLETRVN